MFKLAQEWYKQYFSDQEATILLLFLAALFALIMTMGKPLAPVFTAIVLAYLLQGFVNFLIKFNLSRKVSIVIVYTSFLSLLALFIFVLIPLAWGQLVRLMNDQLPLMISEGNELLSVLPERYPELVSEARVAEMMDLITDTMKVMVESVVTFSVANLPNIMGLLIFLVLVPLLVFFFLKDKDEILGWLVKLLPAERPFINRVATEMNQQISNYVRGKAIEILVVGVVTYIGLSVLSVKYAALLALLVGVSVVIPFIGAAVVTLPVALVAYFQFGWGSEFLWVITVYMVIQALDGNLLVPLLFSEAVNLHPAAIITAVLLFGGLWGLWGVFFAIPLATLVKAMATSWPRPVQPSDKVEWLES